MGRERFSTGAAAVLLSWWALAASVPSSAAATLGYTDLYTLRPPSGLFNPISSGNNHVFTSGQGVGFATVTPNVTSAPHAMLWTPSGAVGVDLNPAGFSLSWAGATNGNRQVGYGQLTNSSPTHALLWSGAADSYVDLHPAGFYSSAAEAISGAQQGGTGQLVANGPSHALLWSGSAASVVDLHPASYSDSWMISMSDTQQVGEGMFPGSNLRALLWTGSAGSCVDLTPAGWANARAEGCGGNEQVGEGQITPDGTERALLWSGSAESYVDLTPSGFKHAWAYGTNGTFQVGTGTLASPNGHGHALLWAGTADSYTDLGAALPATFTDSVAYDIIGNTVYGWAEDVNGNEHAVAWIVTTPEPAGLSLLALLATVALRRQCRSPRCNSGAAPPS